MLILGKRLTIVYRLGNPEVLEHKDDYMMHIWLLLCVCGRGMCAKGAFGSYHVKSPHFRVDTLALDDAYGDFNIFCGVWSE